MQFDEGRILLANGNGTPEYYLKDHLSNVRVAFTEDGTVKQVNSYYPFGMNIYGLTSTETISTKNKYLYNGKEMQGDFNLNLLDYGARFYDHVTSRWISVDPLAEKYPGMSPYGYVANNPINAIDPDGNKIIPITATNYSNSEGSYSGIKQGLSKRTEAMFYQILQTGEGYTFLSQFAKKGDKIGDYVFPSDGKNSNHDLMLVDITLENYTGNITEDFDGMFSVGYSDKDNNLKFRIDLVSIGKDKYDLGESYTHESRLHGYKTDKYIEAFKKSGKSGFVKVKEDEEKNNPSGNKDHDNRNKKNIKSKSYSSYYEQQLQLEQIDPKYKKAFNERDQKVN